MRRFARPIAAMLLCAVASCQRAAPGAGAVARPGTDPVAARLAGDDVHVSDVQRAAEAQGTLRAGEPIDPNSQLFRRTLEAVVDQRLIAREAARQHLDRDAAIKRRLAAAHDKILGDALLERLVDKAVTPAAVQALYDEQKRTARPGEGELHARQIVQDSQAQATAIRRLLQAGGDFQKLAAQRSIDAATRFDGGDLGWFAPSALPPAYGAALAGARPGDLVGPFQAPAGWVIARLEERREPQPLSLKEARPQIVRFLTYDEIRGLLTRLRTDAKVKVMMGPAPPPPAPLPATGARP